MDNKLYLVNLKCSELHQSSDKRAIPSINRPIRVTISSATPIDIIFTNRTFNKFLKKGIIKTSISDHFVIFPLIIKVSNERTKNRKIKD